MPLHPAPPEEKSKFGQAMFGDIAGALTTWPTIVSRAGSISLAPAGRPPHSGSGNQPGFSNLAKGDGERPLTFARPCPSALVVGADLPAHALCSPGRAWKPGHLLMPSSNPSPDATLTAVTIAFGCEYGSWPRHSPEIAKDMLPWRPRHDLDFSLPLPPRTGVLPPLSAHVLPPGGRPT